MPRRYQDVKSAGRSARSECDADWRTRHARRLKAASDDEQQARQWADAYGVTLKISNNGHHWRFYIGSRFAEWWPSSAKLVLDRDYKRGVHCHCVATLKHYLTRHWLPPSITGL